MSRPSCKDILKLAEAHAARHDDHAVAGFDGVLAAGDDDLPAPADAADQQILPQLQLLQRNAAELRTLGHAELQRLSFTADKLVECFDLRAAAGILEVVYRMKVDFISDWKLSYYDI